MKNAILRQSSTFCTALCFFCCPADAGAEAYLKEVNAPVGKAAKLVFKQSHPPVTWQVFESDDCHFYVSYQNNTKKFGTHLMTEDCSAIVSSAYKLLGDDLLIANLASERGGYAYIFHASGHMQWAEAHYDSSDESEFTVTGSKENVSIKTDMSRITARISSTGKIEIRNSGKTAR